MPISFHSEDIIFSLPEKNSIKKWICAVAENEKKKVDSICFIFCSNKKILEINKEYLNHNYFTDIISFDYSKKNFIGGDVFISTETVLENSLRFKTEFILELRRVIIHGVLHFMGYKDKNKIDSLKMRNAENRALELYKSFVPRGTKKKA